MTEKYEENCFSSNFCINDSDISIVVSKYIKVVTNSHIKDIKIELEKGHTLTEPLINNCKKLFLCK